MNEKEIFKYIKGLSTPEEKQRLLDWLDESDNNRKYYLEIRKLWDLSLITTNYSTYSSNDAYESVKRKIGQTKQSSNRVNIRNLAINIGKIAAIAILAVMISQYFFMRQQANENIGHNRVEAPIGNRVRLMLPDKSIVWLNSGTVISYPEKFTGKERVISLNGEAQFEVTKNEKNPFVVKTANHSITVLGTVFNVYAYNESNQYEATLFEGSIMLQSNENKAESVTMKAGQHAIYDKTTRTLEIKNDISTDQMFSWVSGYYSFDKMKFSNMLERLGQYYNKKIDIRNPKIADYECTGKFKTGEYLEHILNVVKVNKPFKYTITEHEIIIY